jgi:Cupin domain.
MKIALKIMMIGVVAVAGAVSTAAAQTTDAHTIVSPSDIKWGPAPASLPSGAEAVTMYGDPSKEGLFALRLKMPKGYSIPPHTHPKPEVVTVISGTGRLGMGETADRSTARPCLRAASLHFLQAWRTTSSLTKTRLCSSTASARGA